MDKPRSPARSRGSRRRETERRQVPDRRRGHDSKCVVLEICRSTVQMALVVHAADGEPRKVVTRSLPWRQQASFLYSDVGIEELTDAMRTLVAEERLAGATVRIALSGAFCVTRVISGTSDEVRREFAELEDRSHRYLTLGPGRKVVASSVQQLDARHDHALLTVANQRTLDAVLAISDRLGLAIATIEPSLVALSRAQSKLRGGSEEACLVIQLDDQTAELGICHRGRLLLDYRPGGHMSSAQVAGVVAQHFTRVQRYLDRRHPYLKSPVRQVYLAGDPAAVARALPEFERFEQFRVAVLDPAQLDAPWQVASESPGPAMSAALGTALLDENNGSDQSPNLMESILAKSREPIRPLLVRSLLPLAAVVLIAAGLFTLFQRERMATNELRAELQQLAPMLTRAREFQLQLTAAEAKLQQLRAVERGLPQPRWGQLLSHIAQSMPEDVWLDELAFLDARTGKVVGASYADGGIYDFVNYLQQLPDVDSIALEGTGVGRSPTGPTTSFNLQLSLTPAHEFAGQEGSP